MLEPTILWVSLLVRVSRDFTNINIIMLERYICNTCCPKLEYAALIWYPAYTFHGASHPKLLARHEMVALTEQREMLAARFLLRLLKGSVDCPYLLSRIFFHVPRLSARH